MYAIVKDGKLQVWDTDLERILFTVEKTMPFLSVNDIRSYADEDIEDDYMGEKWLKGHAPQKPEPLAAEGVRLERTTLLEETDYIILKYTEDNEPIPKKWKVYRQALRDVPQQDGFPFNVEWPEKPE